MLYIYIYTYKSGYYIVFEVAFQTSPLPLQWRCVSKGLTFAGIRHKQGNYVSCHVRSRTNICSEHDIRKWVFIINDLHFVRRMLLIIYLFIYLFISTIVHTTHIDTECSKLCNP